MNIIIYVYKKTYKPVILFYIYAHCLILIVSRIEIEIIFICFKMFVYKTTEVGSIYKMGNIRYWL